MRSVFLGGACKQFQSRSVGAPSSDEARGGGAEHELEHLACLAAHLQAPALLVHGEHGTGLNAAAEVRDAHPGADAWNWS